MWHAYALILDTLKYKTELNVGRELRKYNKFMGSEPEGCLVSLQHYYPRSQKF